MVQVARGRALEPLDARARPLDPGVQAARDQFVVDYPNTSPTCGRDRYTGPQGKNKDIPVSQKATPAGGTDVEDVRRVVGYCRVSTFDQAREGYSLEIQEDAIRAYVTYKGLELVDVIVDPGVSGTVPLRERKGGKQLWTMAVGGGCGVVAYKLDRVGRSAIDLLTAAEAFPALHLLDLQIDTSTTMGKFMLRMLAVFAEMERDMIAERVKDGVERARLNGKRIGQPPYGYTVDDDGRMIRDPGEWAVVERIVGWREAGATYEAIALKLNTLDVPTKQGARWKPVSAQRVCMRAVKEGLLSVAPR